MTYDTLLATDATGVELYGRLVGIAGGSHATAGLVLYPAFGTYATLTDAATVALPTINTPLATALAAKAAGGTTVSLAAATLTINNANAATYNGNIIAANFATAITITIASGITAGFSCGVEQLGAGLVSVVASGTTLNAPNGASTAGLRTTMAISNEVTADTYLVLVQPTADQTFVNASAGATPAVNMALYNIVDLTLTANCTPVFSGSVTGKWYSTTLVLRQDGTGGRTLTLPAATKWSSGVPPTYTTTASAINVITLATLDGGTTYLGFLGGVGFV